MAYYVDIILVHSMLDFRLAEHPKESTARWQRKAPSSWGSLSGFP